MVGDVGGTRLCACVAGALVLHAHAASAETFRVGPGTAYRQLQQLPALAPGDVVELEGGAVYTGGVVFDDAGTASAPIVIRGISAGGARPVIEGGANTVEFRADHYRFENIEVTGGIDRCVFHHAHDITVENAVIHDCPQQGILGADADSGSLTLRHSEVYRCGGGQYDHQIYMATDETAHPGAVFRMEFNYVHDGNGGHNVKSRAERNEIYYNWIEGALYHELELIGPDGQAEDAVREDSDVVGNVLRKSGGNAGFFVVRVGGDGTGQTWGRYRFAYNTILISDASSPSAVFRIFHGVDSVEMHNNVITRIGGGPSAIPIYRTAEAEWASGGEVVTGSNNWIPMGAVAVPPAWQATITGSDPGFNDPIQFDISPAADSPLVDAALPATTSPSGHPFPGPLAAPAWLPPIRAPLAPGQERARTSDGAMDIGALEFGAVDDDDAGDDPPGEPDEGGGVPEDNTGANHYVGGCSASGRPSGAVAGLLLLALLIVRRRRVI